MYSFFCQDHITVLVSCYVVVVFYFFKLYSQHYLPKLFDGAAAGAAGHADHVELTLERPALADVDGAPASVAAKLRPLWPPPLRLSILLRLLSRLRRLSSLHFLLVHQFH